MDIVQLQNFQAIAKFQHLTRAAEYLNISQPALSVSLSKLEREVGASLFDRVGRSICLNECGKIYLRYVDSVLVNLTNAQTEINDYVGKFNRTLTLYMSCKAGVEHYLLGFKSMFPEIILRRYEIFASDIDISMERDSCDFITVAESTPESRNCNCEVLASDKVLAVVHKNHPLAGRESVDVAELKCDKFITLPLGYSYRTMTDSMCQAAGFTCNVVHEFFFCQIFTCVANGVGVSLVTDSVIDSTCSRSFYKDHLRFIPISGEHNVEKIALIWPKNKLLSKEARLFLDYIRDEKRKQAASSCPK